MKTSCLLFITLFFLFSAKPVISRQNQGFFELKLKTFYNKFDKDNSGQCCGDSLSGSCSGACATKFRVCLKQFQANIDHHNECTFGESHTPVLSKNSGPASLSDKIVSFPLDFKWPGTFSLIIEAWHENNRTSDSLISRMATQQPLDAGASWIRGQHNEAFTKLEYEYRVVCSSHYYGKDCDTLCRPRNDLFGHYTCGRQGEKVCLPGWQKDLTKSEGDYCTKAICSSGCDSEHGYCDTPDTCKCKTGWSGPLCNECVRYPGCEHGYCINSFECICENGWGGLFCKNDLNYCTNHEPCENGATCYNTGQGSYTCSCPPGFSGKNCEIEANEPCNNGGTLQADGKCSCPLGFAGDKCEVLANKCSDSPCKNSIGCRNARNGYYCECKQGYSGANCDIRSDLCLNNPCDNSGKCKVNPFGSNYTCECPAGFTGVHCELNIDDCSEEGICQNSGTCIDFVDDYECACPPGFTGKHCEINVDDCDSDPCANGGSCHDLINDFICVCRPGYTGRDCSIEINECSSNPCMNDGFCFDRINDFECRCPPGFGGKTCNVLPDGSLMSPRTAMKNSQKVLVALGATIIPILVILAVVILLCKKRRRMNEQMRVNADAARENELNSVNSVNKTKMLDDHMIVNSLDFPKQKNSNIADENDFGTKKSVIYKQMCKDNKQLNSEYSRRLEKSYVDKLMNSSNNGRFESEASSVVSSTVSSVHSSKSGKSSKSYNLPTAASINSASSTYVFTDNKYPQDDDLLATEV